MISDPSPKTHLQSQNLNLKKQTFFRNLIKNQIKKPPNIQHLNHYIIITDLMETRGETQKKKTKKGYSFFIIIIFRFCKEIHKRNLEKNHPLSSILFRSTKKKPRWGFQFSTIYQWATTISLFDKSKRDSADSDDLSMNTDFTATSFLRWGKRGP